MAGILDQYQRAGFNGIEFACERYSAKGGLREAVHEYRHTPAGQPEKQGRRLYTFEFDAIFNAQTPAYPTAFPDDWDQLINAFEQGKTADLVVPTIGTIPAYCIDWPLDVDYKSFRDGIRAHLVFREDQQQLFSYLINGDINPDALPAKSNNLIETALDLGLGADLFSSITNLINDIASAGDYYEMQAELYADKVGGIITACQRVDEKVSELNDPKNWKVVRANVELCNAAIAVSEKILRQSVPIISFAAPTLMSVLDVATSLYGDTSRAGEILGLNRDPIIDDAFSIKPGTIIRAYAAQ